jgi:DNA modification methylase
LYDNEGVDKMPEPYESAVYIKTAESEGQVHHPTQKPVALGRYLIRTYTNPGDVVLDNACGSGSFLLAALLEGRKFIGIEKNENVLLHKVQATDYIRVSIDRIANVLKELQPGNTMAKHFKEPLIINHTINYEPMPFS